MATSKIKKDIAYYAYGENVSYGNVASFAGCLTSGSKEIRFCVYTPRMIPQNAVLTLTSMTGSIRGINGYIGSANTNWLTGSGYTTAFNKKTDYIAEVVITFTESQSTANNTPITYMGSFSFNVGTPS